MANLASDYECDVTIAGAGISGLTAAYYVKKKDPKAKILVLEGKDRVGGRTQTIPLVCASGTDSWDLGGQWVGRCQPHAMKLLSELGLETYEQFHSGKKLLQIGSDKVCAYTSDIPDLSWLALLDLQLMIWRLEYYQKQLDVLDVLDHPNSKQWDNMSVAAYCDKHMFTQAARQTITAAQRCIFGCELQHISFLYYLWYIRAAGGLNKLIECTSNTAQEYKIKGGAQSISHKLRDKIGANHIKLQETVAKVEQVEHAVHITTLSGLRIKSKYVILAAPPKALEFIQFSPSLPSSRLDFTKKMTMGNIIKVIVTYETPFWRFKGLSGEFVSDGGKTHVSGCSMGPLCIGFDATSFNDCPALVSFIGGQSWVQWSSQDAKTRQKAVLDHLAKFFGDEVFVFLDYVEKDWSREQLSWGGPVSYLGTGAMSNFIGAIRKPFRRIHFAGTETATEWTGFISGAIQAGERSAFEVLQKLNPSALTNFDLQILDNKRLSSRVKTKVDMFALGKFAVITLGVGAFTIGVIYTARQFK